MLYKDFLLHAKKANNGRLPKGITNSNTTKSFKYNKFVGLVYDNNSDKGQIEKLRAYLSGRLHNVVDLNIDDIEDDSAWALNNLSEVTYSFVSYRKLKYQHIYELVEVPNQHALDDIINNESELTFEDYASSCVLLRCIIGGGVVVFERASEIISGDFFFHSKSCLNNLSSDLVGLILSIDKYKPGYHWVVADCNGRFLALFDDDKRKLETNFDLSVQQNQLLNSEGVWS